MSYVRNLIDKAGGPAHVARLLGLKSHTALLKWKKVPVGRILALEQATGIPREQLRPDLYRQPLPTRPKRAKEPANV